jgi:acetyl esterase/lipase
VSLRLRILNAVLRGVVRRRLATVEDPLAARAEFDLFARLLLRPPRGTRLVPAPAPAPCPPLVWAVPPGGPGPDAAPARGAVLYLHGGAFIAGSPRTHAALAARLARLSGLPVCLPDYRLAPEYPFPAAWDDARAAWEALLALGLPPARIALAGDSAGGGLALSLLADLCAAGAPPAAAALFSPFADLTASGPAWRENAERDVFLPAARLPDLIGFVLAGHPPADPRASPLFASFPCTPPILLQVSETELLRDDSLALARRLAGEGAAVEVECWPDTPHGWQIFTGRLPEADAAVASAARFLARAFAPGAGGVRAAAAHTPGDSGRR